MGCDIHPFIQVKTDPDHDTAYDWETVAVPEQSRCYPFFAALAGVRDIWGHPPLAEGRGLPENLFKYQADQYLSGEHSATWFTLAEMRGHDVEWLKSVYPEGDGPWQIWQRWIRIGQFYAFEYDVPDEWVRYIMDFDS